MSITISPGQSVVFCARIFDHNTGLIILPDQVTSITYTASKTTMTLNNLSRQVVTGHANVNVPIVPTLLESAICDEFWHVDQTGYNFIHVPNTRDTPLFNTVGSYEVTYTILPIDGNPIVIPFKVKVE